MAELYPWIKAGHISAVIFWMAAILYLPRLFIYHVNALNNKEKNPIFEIMERRLLKIIMTPSMLFAWGFGLLLLSLYPSVFDWSLFWPWVKILMVLALSAFHMWCAAERKRLLRGEIKYSLTTYRLLNELPALLAIIIVVSVVVRPL